MHQSADPSTIINTQQGCYMNDLVTVKLLFSDPRILYRVTYRGVLEKKIILKSFGLSVMHSCCCFFLFCFCFSSRGVFVCSCLFGSISFVLWFQKLALVWTDFFLTSMDIFGAFRISSCNILRTYEWLTDWLTVSLLSLFVCVCVLCLPVMFVLCLPVMFVCHVCMS